MRFLFVRIKHGGSASSLNVCFSPARVWKTRCLFSVFALWVQLLHEHKGHAASSGENTSNRLSPESTSVPPVTQNSWWKSLTKQEPECSSLASGHTLIHESRICLHPKQHFTPSNDSVWCVFVAQKHSAKQTLPPFLCLFTYVCHTCDVTLSWTVNIHVTSWAFRNFFMLYWNICDFPRNLSE